MENPKKGKQTNKQTNKQILWGQKVSEEAFLFSCFNEIFVKVGTTQIKLGFK